MRKIITIWLAIILPIYLFGEGAMVNHKGNIEVYRGPVFDSTDTYSLHIDSVIVAKDTTYICCTYTGLEASWANISDSTYLEDVESNEKYHILRSLGLPFSPNRRDYKDGEIFNVIFMFPSIKKTKKFNFIEDKDQKSFNVYNIDLNHCIDTVFSLKDLVQLIHSKDSFVLSKDTLNLLITMEQIYNVESSLYGVKSDNYANCVINAMNIYEEFKLWENAISHADKIRSLLFDIYEYRSEFRSKLKILDLQILLKKADYYARLNKIEDALSLYHQYISTFNEIDSLDRDYRTYKTVLSEMADYYLELDDKNKAIECYNECFELCEEQGKYNDYDIYLKCAINYYSVSGLYHSGIAFSETELRNLPEYIDNKQQAILSFSLFDNYNHLGDTEKMIYYGKKTCQLLKGQTGKDEMTMNFYSLLGLGAAYYGYYPNLDKAEECFKEALNLLTKYNLNDYSAVSHIYHFLSKIYEIRGDSKLAIEMETKNGEICNLFLDSISSAEHLFEMGCLFFNQYCYEEAIIYFQRSLDMYKQTKSTRVGELCMLLVRSNLEIQDSIEAFKYAKELINYYTEYTPENEKDLFSLASTYYLIKDYKNAELLFYSLLEQIQIDISTNYEIMNEKEKQLKIHKFNEYLFTYQTIISTGEKNSEQLSRLYNFILFSKSLFLFSEYQKEDYNITWRDIQKELSINDIAIEFFETYPEGGDRTYNAIILDRNHEFPQMVTLFRLDDYMNYIIKLNEQKFDELPDSIDINDFIWYPIFDKCEEEVKRIFFSPDGCLNYFNIECTLIDYDVSVYRLSSTSQIVRNQKRCDYAKAVLYGGLDYDSNIEMELVSKREKRENHLYRELCDRSGFEPLDNAYEEVKTIDYLLNNKGKSSSLFVGKEGTEESFKKLSGKKVELLHLATHGKFILPNEAKENAMRDKWKFMEIIENEDNPLLEDYNLTHSFLAMSGGNKLAFCDSIPEGMDDGILTAQEISKLDLRELELVILSACQSALGNYGKDGNIYGLQRGFKKAGANTIIMSLSKVDDEATKLFMIEFYKNLLYGETKMQSFKNAQEYLRQVENGKYDDPKFWGAFIMLDGLN